MAERLDQPKEYRKRRLRFSLRSESTAKVAEGIARFTGTPQFLVWLTMFVLVWLAWNSWGPTALRFDKSEYGFTALTLMLSLQASFAAPLILLAQNRQDDRDRVTAEQDRQRAERNLAGKVLGVREVALGPLAVLFGRHPVAVVLTVLGEQDERGGVRRLQREHQRECGEAVLRLVEAQRRRAPGVPREPHEDEHRQPHEELRGAGEPRDALGHLGGALRPQREPEPALAVLLRLVESLSHWGPSDRRCRCPHPRRRASPRGAGCPARRPPRSPRAGGGPGRARAAPCCCRWPAGVSPWRSSRRGSPPRRRCPGSCRAVRGGARAARAGGARRRGTVPSASPAGAGPRRSSSPARG